MSGGGTVQLKKRMMSSASSFNGRKPSWKYLPILCGTPLMGQSGESHWILLSGEIRISGFGLGPFKLKKGSEVVDIGFRDPQIS